MLNLVTGYRGTAHVTADEEALKNQMTFSDFHVTEHGEQLGSTLVSNNQLRIHSGDFMVQGRFVRLENYEDVTIETGTQSMYRNDLICLRYEKDGGTGIESVKLVNIKGAEAATATAAEVPAHNEGIIVDGNSPVDFPLYKVALEGLNVKAVTAMFTVSKNIQAQLHDKSSGGYEYGTEDLVAGSSELAAGTLYFVYE